MRLGPEMLKRADALIGEDQCFTGAQSFNQERSVSHVMCVRSGLLGVSQL